MGKVANFAPYALGLDIGTNSIGWALIRIDKNNVPTGIENCGVRIFQEAVEAKSRTPKNAARRAARLLRRVLARRARRKRKLRNFLIKHELLPVELADETAKAEVVLNELGDPYELRAKGLDHALKPHEFGRVLLHLCARRGFLSNRKANLAAYLADEFEDFISQMTEDEEAEISKKDEEEAGKIKEGIKTLSDEMQAYNSRTLGEFLHGLDKHVRKRARYTSRQMYLDEFNKLWDVQSRYLAFLDDNLKAAAHQIIFFQRPLKSQKDKVGRCLLEPMRKRAAKARLESQQFRIWQDINNLQIQDPQTREWRRLEEQQRQELFEVLHQQKSITWGGLRKLFGIHKGEKFNLEESKKNLIGNLTWIDLHTILGERWEAMDEQERVALTEDLLTISDLKARAQRLRELWRFTREQQYKLCIWQPQPEYTSHSLKAIRKLLPYLKQGLIYSDARQAAGYSYEVITFNKSFLPEPPPVRNPVAQKALYEVRRVVNTIIKKYGKPAHITVELARDMKLSKDQKRALDKQNKANFAANKEAARAVREELGVDYASHDDKLKYRLWLECNETCPYTGRSISRNQLFSDSVDIEHILPYDRTLDDSYMNKTICWAEFNRRTKKNQTPWETLGGKPEEWEQLLQRIRKWPKPKRDRMERKQLDKIDDFITRQLNDTRIICRETLGYLKQLGSDVNVSRGALTADLRHHWGLNSLLSIDDETKERKDHRHHAIDAVVIALTTQRMLQQLSTFSARNGSRSLKEHLSIELPWPDFRNSVESSLSKIIISHAASRKLSGALNEETAYGLRADGRYVYRKPLNTLFKAEMAKGIVDPYIRQLVIEHLDNHENDPKKAFSTGNYPQLKDGDGSRPIRKVRIFADITSKSVFPIKNQRGEQYKYLKYGNNHHVEIIENISTGKREGRFVTMLEAARRARIYKQSIIDRSAPKGYRFVMSLGINDLVELPDIDSPDYYRVQKISEQQIALRHHLASTLNDNSQRVLLSVGTTTKISRKIAVDSIGNITTAND